MMSPAPAASLPYTASLQPSQTIFRHGIRNLVVDFVDALPRNATGKVLKHELRARYWQGRERNVN